jgi:hypothetical protein
MLASGQATPTDQAQKSRKALESTSRQTWFFMRKG